MVSEFFSVKTIDMLKVFDVPKYGFGMSVNSAYMRYSSTNDFQLPGDIFRQSDVGFMMGAIERKMW